MSDAMKMSFFKTRSELSSFNGRNQSLHNGMWQVQIETQDFASLLTVSHGERKVNKRQGESGACGERHLIGHCDGGEEEQNAQSH